MLRPSKSRLSKSRPQGRVGEISPVEIASVDVAACPRFCSILVQPFMPGRLDKALCARHGAGTRPAKLPALAAPVQPRPDNAFILKFPCLVGRFAIFDSIIFICI